MTSDGPFARSSSTYIADDRYVSPWIFLATTGCRRGECLGLRWADLEFDDATAPSPGR